MRILMVMMAVMAVAGPVLGNTGVVEEVIQGGTVRIGATFVARLTGLDVPDTTTSLGRLIRGFAAQEIEGKLIKLFTWTTDNTAAGIVRDDDGLPFVQIYYGDDMMTSFNEMLLKKGYARVDREHLPQELGYFLDLEREARSREFGLWAGKGR